MSRDPLTHAPGYAGSPQGYAGANPVMNTDPGGLRFAPDEGLAEQGGGYGRTGDLTPDDGFDAQAYYSPQNEEVYPGPDPDPTPPAANGDPAADAAPPAASAKDNDSFRDRTKDEATRGAEWLEGTSDMLEIGGAVGFLAIAGAGCATGTYCSAGLMAGYTVAQIAWKSAAAATVVAGGLRCWAGDYDGCSRDLFWGTVGGGLSLLAPVSVEQRAGTAAMHLASVAVGHLTDPGAW